MTPFHLAWSNLSHKQTRTTIAASGVAFAVTLIFMELGLLGSVGRTATMLFDKLNFDLLLTSSEYLDLSRPGDFSRERLAQSRAVDGVDNDIPLFVGVGTWRLPAQSGLLGIIPGGGTMSINIIATPPAQLERAFRIGPDGVFPSVDAARVAGSELGRLDAFLFDRHSKPEFGDVEKLISVSKGRSEAVQTSNSGSESKELLRLNGQRIVVVGAFDLGTGFSWNGMLMTSGETYAQFMMRSTEQVNFGLIHLASGRDPAEVQHELQAVLPGDVKVFTRKEINASERRYWLRLTSIGQLLGVAVVLAVVVGIIFVYQMMAADIRNMLPEYATVKALGYRPPYLTAIVLWQALLLAVLGYGPGFLASLCLFAAARTWGGIPTSMTVEIAAGVFILTAGMCLASGFLAVRKVHAADPADLF